MFIFLYIHSTKPSPQKIERPSRLETGIDIHMPVNSNLIILVWK